MTLVSASEKVLGYGPGHGPRGLPDNSRQMGLVNDDAQDDDMLGVSGVVLLLGIDNRPNVPARKHLEPSHAAAKNLGSVASVDQDWCIFGSERAHATNSLPINYARGVWVARLSFHDLVTMSAPHHLAAALGINLPLRATSPGCANLNPARADRGPGSFSRRYGGRLRASFKILCCIFVAAITLDANGNVSRRKPLIQTDDLRCVLCQEFARNLSQQRFGS